MSSANRGVHISLANGQLGGTLQTNDGISLYVITGTDETVSGVSYVAGTPILITSLTDMASQGISETGNPFAYRQVKEFYDEAGEGAQLYLMLVPSTMTLAQMADNTNADGVVKLLNYAQGTARLVGLLFDVNDPDYEGTTTAALDGSVATAATNMKVTSAAYFAKQMPFRCIIGGIGYTGVAASLANQLSGSNNRVAILIGDTQAAPDGGKPVACVGLALGRLARIAVSTMMSRVADGSLPINAAFLNADAVEDVLGDLNTISDKGYITFRTFPLLSGYFFSGDDTCSPETDDYHQLARGRAIDKAQTISYLTYVQRVDDSVPTISGGLPDPAWATWMQQQVINQLANTMQANGEVSGVDCLIPLNQDITSTGKIMIKPRIRPEGYLRDIEIELGFEL